jgi:hypothetical protein
MHPALLDSWSDQLTRHPHATSTLHASVVVCPPPLAPTTNLSPYPPALAIDALPHPPALVDRPTALLLLPHMSAPRPPVVESSRSTLLVLHASTPHLSKSPASNPRTRIAHHATTWPSPAPPLPHSRTRLSSTCCPLTNLTSNPKPHGCGNEFSPTGVWMWVRCDWPDSILLCESDFQSTQPIYIHMAISNSCCIQHLSNPN